MASRGLLGAFNGLGQGMQQGAQTMAEMAKFKYMQELQEKSKADDRAYQEKVRQEGYDREDASTATKKENITEGDKHFTVAYNAAGEEIAREQYTPEKDRTVFAGKDGMLYDGYDGTVYREGQPGSGSGSGSGSAGELSDKDKLRIKDIDSQLSELRKKAYDDSSKDKIAEFERRREAILTGGDHRPAKDITSEVVDGMLFDGSGKGLLSPKSSKPAAQEQPSGPKTPPAEAISELRANKDNPIYLKSFSKRFGDPSKYIDDAKPKEPRARNDGTFIGDAVLPIWDRTGAHVVDAVKEGQASAAQYEARKMFDYYSDKGGVVPEEAISEAWPFLSQQERQNALAKLPPSKRGQFTQKIAQR